MTVLLGRQTAGASADFNVNPAAWKFTAAASGTLATLKAQTQVANAEATSLEIGIYDDTGGGSRPGAKLASGSTSTGVTSTGVISVDVSASAVSITAGTVYWLAWHGSTHWDFKGDSGGSYVELTTSQSLPATWPVSNGSGTVNAILWGESAAGGGGQTVSPAGRTSVSTFGAVTATPGAVTAQVAGHTSASSFGTVAAVAGTVTVTVTGHESVSVFGTVTPAPGPVAVQVAGRTSASSYGVLSGTTAGTVAVDGHTSLSSYGAVSTSTGPVAIGVAGHTSASLLGTVGIEGQTSTVGAGYDQTPMIAATHSH